MSAGRLELPVIESRSSDTCGPPGPAADWKYIPAQSSLKPGMSGSYGAAFFTNTFIGFEPKDDAGGRDHNLAISIALRTAVVGPG